MKVNASRVIVVATKVIDFLYGGVAMPRESMRSYTACIVDGCITQSKLRDCYVGD